MKLIFCLLVLCLSTVVLAPPAAAQAGWTPDTLPVIAEVVDGPSTIVSSGHPISVCIPTSFLTGDIQPIVKDVYAAAGFCSDAPVYQAVSTDGILEFEAEILSPYEVTIVAGTDATFFPDDFFPLEVSCDSILPPLLALPPCELVSVRVTADASYWTVADATGLIEVVTVGDPPVGRVPEPGFGIALFAGILFLRRLNAVR